MKRLRAWQQIVLDVIFAGILICIFAYFHHIRIFWGIGVSDGDETDSANVVITKPEQPDDPENPSTPSHSDMFGKKFADKFLKEGEKTISTDSLYVSKDIRLEYSINTTTIDGCRMQYHLIDVYIRNIENLNTNVNIKKRVTFDSLITDNTIAAISGDYCGNVNASKEVLRNGKELRANNEIIFDIGVLCWDGSFKCYTPSEYNRSEILKTAPYQIWNFGPGLFDKNGNVRNDFQDTYGEYILNKHPRQIFGYYEPGHYCFVTIEGRIAESEGATFETAGKLLKSLGCTAAYNLDGGASAYTYYNGTMVRYTDQDKQDNPRKLYDIIAIVEVE